MKTLADSIPNQAALINTIPLLEAKDSFEIENIVTTTDRLFRFAFDSEKRTDHATKEAMRYRTALFEGFQSMQSRPLCVATASEICTVIKATPMDIRDVPGTALANDKTGAVIYTPPVGADVIREKLNNWERFLHYESEIDPLIRMAVGHYQFEAIHPFTEVTQEQNWEPWVLFMLSAVAETATWTAGKTSAIRELMDETVNYIRKSLPKIYTRELVETIFVQPYCRINNLVEQNIARRETASAYLKSLCEMGVLQEEKMGRDKIFIHPKFMRLLTSAEHIFERY